MGVGDYTEELYNTFEEVVHSFMYDKDSDKYFLDEDGYIKLLELETELYGMCKHDERNNP